MFMSYGRAMTRRERRGTAARPPAAPAALARPARPRQLRRTKSSSARKYTTANPTSHSTPSCDTTSQVRRLNTAAYKYFQMIVLHST